MKTIDCKGSSNLASINYDEKSQELTVGFQNGSTYVYDNVLPTTWDAFNAADSKGSFLSREIQRSHVSRRTV